MRTAVVTGASSGIGAASARALAASGFHVYCLARRTDRIEDLAQEIGGTPIECDITDTASVQNAASVVGPRLNVLVNNAGGAFGVDPVVTADLSRWQHMYELNVLGTVAVTQAFTPALIASGAGTIINIGSTAGHSTYEGGGGYTAAKHALKAVTETLRLELNGQPVRVSEVAPGMVHTEEFSLNRYAGDQSLADAVYAGVDQPLLAADIADAVDWIATRPQHVNIDLMVVRPIAQATNWKVARNT